MDWNSLLTIITTLGVSGGAIYLIIDKLFARRDDAAAAHSKEIANGNDVADLYNKIDEIVERKTRPIREKLDKTYEEMKNMEQRYCCYRNDCEMRIRSKYDAVDNGDIDD